MLHVAMAPIRWLGSVWRGRSIGDTAWLGHRAAILAGCLCAAPPALAQGSAQDTAPLPAETAHPCAPNTDPAAPRILVTVTGARRVAGNITFTLYGDRPAAFLAHKGSIALDRVGLRDSAASACFAVSRPGTYAVAVYHDENDNHHFDRSLIGLPVEGYGFSNNAPIFMAPPSFGAVRFAVPPGVTRLSIALRY
jgi:uncharacterized protein (DUF2141 family)